MFFLRRRFVQQLTFRELVVIFALVGISILARETDHKFHGDDGDVMRIGPAPTGLLYGPDRDLANKPSVDAPTGIESFLGVRYDHIGAMDIDVLRWGGHLSVYEDQGSFLKYRDLEPGEIDTYDLHVPWRVYLPEGLIVLLCLLELGLAARKPRTARFALIAGGVAGVIAIIFRLMGLSWECAMPAVIAVHHLSIGIMPLLRRDEADEPAVEAAAEEAPARPSPPPRRETASRTDDDPFRSPPQAPPIVVQRAQTEPAAVPVEHDHNAAKPKPKLLT